MRPPPEPAKSGLHGSPSGSLVAPNPYGEPGSTSVALRMRSGAETSMNQTTEPPIELPTMCAVSMPRWSSSAYASSARSPRPRVASVSCADRRHRSRAGRAQCRDSRRAAQPSSPPTTSQTKGCRAGKHGNAVFRLLNSTRVVMRAFEIVSAEMPSIVGMLIESTPLAAQTVCAASLFRPCRRANAATHRQNDLFGNFVFGELAAQWA